LYTEASPSVRVPWYACKGQTLAKLRRQRKKSLLTSTRRQLDEFEPAEAAPMTSRFTAETPTFRSQSAIKNPYRPSPPSSNHYRPSPQARNSPIIKPPSLTGSTQGRRAPSVISENGRGRRVPSVAGSDTGYRPGDNVVKPFFLRRCCSGSNAPDI